jgi:hypothetical protein
MQAEAGKLDGRQLDALFLEDAREHLVADLPGAERHVVHFEKQRALGGRAFRGLLFFFVRWGHVFSFGEKSGTL